METPTLSFLQAFYFQKEIDYRLVRCPEDLERETTKRIRYLVAGNGAFLESENELLHVRKKLAACRIKGLVAIDERFELRIPKAPEEILLAMIRKAIVYAYAGPAPLESMFYVYYSKTQKTFQVIEPDQERQATRVSYDWMPDVLGDLTAVLDLHSHGFCAPFLSDEDRNSSSGFGLYGVIGDLDKRTRFVLYLGVYGEFFPIAPDSVFQLSETTAAGLSF